MVRMQDSSDSEKLDRLVSETCARHGLSLEVTGWARKTYDIYLAKAPRGRSHLVARVESFATTSGEIRVFSDQGVPFAEDLGRQLEATFGLREAILIRAQPPE